MSIVKVSCDVNLYCVSTTEYPILLVVSIKKSMSHTYHPTHKSDSLRVAYTLFETGLSYV